MSIDRLIVDKRQSSERMRVWCHRYLKVHICYVDVVLNGKGSLMDVGCCCACTRVDEEVVLQ